MSSFLAKWLARYKGFVLGVLGPLGVWGALLAGAVDSGTIPIPMDPLIATWAWNDHRHAWIYVVMAAAGSAIGGLIPFLLGRAGGELFLLRRIDRDRYEAMMARFEKQEFLAMAIPSALPPPTPWKAFVFGAGVFEMKIWHFMLAVFVGRAVRFGTEAALTIKYGPQIVDVVGDLFKHHLTLTLVIIAIAGRAAGLLGDPQTLHKIRRRNWRCQRLRAPPPQAPLALAEANSKGPAIAGPFILFCAADYTATGLPAASFAVFARALKATASFVAMSARIFRSSSIPASFSPWISCE